MVVLVGFVCTSLLDTQSFSLKCQLCCNLPPLCQSLLTLLQLCLPWAKNSSYITQTKYYSKINIWESVKKHHKPWRFPTHVQWTCSNAPYTYQHGNATWKKICSFERFCPLCWWGTGKKLRSCNIQSLGLTWSYLMSQNHLEDKDSPSTCAVYLG